MYKVILILDKFFLKYEGRGVKLTPSHPPPPQKKLSSKSPVLLGLSSKYNQKLLDHARLSARLSFRHASKRAIQKTAEATGDLIGNKIAHKITRVSKTSPQNNLETNEEEMLSEKYISPELRQKIMDYLKLKED